MRALVARTARDLTTVQKCAERAHPFRWPINNVHAEGLNLCTSLLAGHGLAFVALGRRRRPGRRPPGQSPEHQRPRRVIAPRAEPVPQKAILRRAGRATGLQRAGRCGCPEPYGAHTGGRPQYECWVVLGLWVHSSACRAHDETHVGPGSLSHEHLSNVPGVVHVSSDHEAEFVPATQTLTVGHPDVSPTLNTGGNLCRPALPAACQLAAARVRRALPTFLTDPSRVTVQ